MNPAHVFVGTLYCGEGDYEKCRTAVLGQVDVSVTHCVISNMPEKVAHNQLWREWREAKAHHDLFVKVDADTVLASPWTLSQIVGVFRANPRVTGLQAPLHDYMTDGHINGLNAFDTRVIFNDTADGLFCDRNVDTNHDVVVRGPALPESLRPAGKHCHHATERQAFHYGLHRALKGQTHIIDSVRAAWEKHGDVIRAFALAGAAANGHCAAHNYADAAFEEAFLEAQARLR